MENTSIERVRRYFAQWGMEDRVLSFPVSSATVELAAQALDVAPERIAKTLCFKAEEGCLLLVAAGDARIDNARFRQCFSMKARMLGPEEVWATVGHPVGGVCPFALPEGVPVYLDVSLQRFTTVFPACGSANSAIELSCDQLARYSGSRTWVDVCKDWGEEASG